MHCSFKALGAAVMIAGFSCGALAADYQQASGWAASGGVAGVFAWTEPTSNAGIPVDGEIASIVAGGDFLINLDNNWNLQFGGAWRNNDNRFSSSLGGFGLNQTEFQANALAFYRDPGMGVFGLEVGFSDPQSLGDIFFFSNAILSGERYIRVGGVAEYFASDMMTFTAFGGALVPFDSQPQIDTGFYAGGRLTYYAAPNIAVAAFANYQHTRGAGDGDVLELDVLRVGGTVRYQTALSGVQLYASGAYLDCDVDTNVDLLGTNLSGSGAEFTVGVNLALGGVSGDLATVDRSSTIDTRTWGCSPAFSTPAGP